MSDCKYCHGFGYCQVYAGGRVKRVYCDCKYGDQRIEEIKEALREVGVDPKATWCRWPRRSEYNTRY